MENVITKYKTELIDCPTCGGKGITTCYSSSDRNSTANNISPCKCKTCDGKGKLEKMIITTEIYKIWKI